MDYDSITDAKLAFVDGQENASGIQELAYFIPLSWLATVAEPVAAGTTAAGLVEIPGNHIMVAGKTPIEIQPLYSKSGVASTLEGEELSKIFKQGPAEFFLPNISAKGLGTTGALKNYRGIVLFKRIGDGATDGFWQIGSRLLAASVEAIDTNWGTGPTGEVGSKITFGSYGIMPAYLYKGEFPVAA